MKLKMKSKSLIAIVALAVTMSGCTAKYRTVHDKTGAEATPGEGDQVGKIPNGPTTINETDDSFVITADPLIVPIGDKVTFTGDCGEGEGKVIAWDFADTKTAEGTNVEHAWEAAGKYMVKANCTETKEDGSTDTKEEQVEITVTPPSEDGTDGDGTDDQTDGTDGDSADDTNDGSDDNGADDNGADDDADGADDDNNIGDDTDDSADTADGTDGTDATDGMDTTDGADGSVDDDDDDDDVDGDDGNNPGQNPGQSPYQGPVKKG